MRWSPHITVAAVIRDSAGRHLLVEEAPDGTPVYNQPAGHLEPGESLHDAVIREVREETCRVFRPTALLGVYRWQTTAIGDTTYLRFCFLGETNSKIANQTRDPTILGLRWAQPDELTSGYLPLRSPLVMQCVHDAERGITHPLDLLHDMETDDGG